MIMIITIINYGGWCCLKIKNKETKEKNKKLKKVHYASWSVVLRQSETGWQLTG